MNLHCKRMAYGDNVIFSNLHFSPEKNKITCILGSSGCGKTTLLKMISGLVHFEGERDFPSDISYAFQTPRLIPSRTVKQNVEFVLSQKITDKQQRSRLVDDMLKATQLDGVAKAYPSSLSGGMAQRVSMVRAYCYPASLLLMDEPFQSLDIKLKSALVHDFLKMHQANARTVVLVTHDLDEALLLADRILVLDAPPNGILADISVDIPHDERVLRSPQIAELRANIYEILIK